ncbi:MAG: hypothetical protein ABI718_15995 [Acidobacteriota bacterium]
MKASLCILGLLFAPVVHAETYIVPVDGVVESLFRTSWSAFLHITNPHDTAVRVHVDAVFPRAPQPRCVVTPDFDLPGHSTTLLIGSSFCEDYFNTLEAFQFTTSESVIPVLDVRWSDAFKTNLQSVPVANSWLPANRAIAVTRIQNAGGTRTNLLLVNPNATPLEVRYRKLFDPMAGEYLVVVPPQTLLLQPILGSEFACPEVFIPEIPVDVTCGLSVRANQTFYVGASVIANETNDAIFRPPSVLPE